MKRVLMAMAVLAVMGTLPCFAADGQPTTGVAGQTEAGVRDAAKGGFIPEHLLVMAYHKNLLTFAHLLDKTARKAPTVPSEFARTAVMEMRRSVNEVEKYRAIAMRSMPGDMTHHEKMQKMMDEHLVAVKTHLSELEILVRNERVPSQEVLKHLEAIEKTCAGAECGMDQGEKMHGWGGMYDCERCGQRDWHHHRHGMMPAHGKMMEGMLQRIKAEDAELAKATASMNSATGERKVNLLADIVTRMVKQHADMTSHMERMMHEHMSHGAGGPMHPMMHGGGQLQDEEMESCSDECDDGEE